MLWLMNFNRNLVLWYTNERSVQKCSNAFKMISKPPQRDNVQGADIMIGKPLEYPKENKDDETAAVRFCIYKKLVASSPKNISAVLHTYA